MPPKTTSTGLQQSASTNTFPAIRMNTTSPPGPATPIVVAGGANMDVLGRADSPLVPGDSIPGNVRISRGGVARNVAENLARMGQKACLISAVGDDDMGRRLLQETAFTGVNVDAVACFSGQRTASYVALSSPDGQLALGLNDMRVMDLLTPVWLETHRALLETADVLVLDCNLSEAALGWLVHAAPRARVFVDAVSAVKCTRLQGLLGQVHTLKLNRLEAQALTGGQIETPDDAAAAAAYLQDAGVQNVVISLGQRGVCWRGQNGAMGHNAAQPVAVVNTNGAGDALLAGLVDGHLKDLPLAQAVAWGAACAEITLMSPSANADDLNTGTVAARVLGPWRQLAHEPSQ